MGGGVLWALVDAAKGRHLAALPGTRGGDGVGMEPRWISPFFLADFSQKKIDLVICSDIVVELIDVIDNWDWVYGISNYT